MEDIATYIILDVETTGLPSTNYGDTKITEISLLSVMKKHFDETATNVVPRVVNKLTMCFHPEKFICPKAQSITGLSNELLEEQGTFNKNFCEILHNYILRSPQPVCLLAHNGYRFDFPLIQAQTKILGKPLPDGILCADTLHAFRDLKIVEQPPPRHIPHDVMEPYTPLGISNEWPENEKDFVFSSDILKVVQGCPVKNDGFETSFLKFLDEIEESVYNKCLGMETKDAIPNIYETTPTKRVKINKPPVLKNKPPPHESFTSERIRRKMDFDTTSPKGCRPSYRLEAVHQHMFGKCIDGAHSAEGDTLALLRCITAIGAPFHDWVLNNHRKLNTILKMW